MEKLITFLFLFIAFLGNGQAATWIKLRDNGNSTLMLDKQSILEKDLLKRAWVKIDYKIPQKSQQAEDRAFNRSKLLWYFDCPAQKSATSQVFQYMDDQLVYSAAIEAKNAEFIEPVPESDVDIAMHQTCRKESSIAATDKAKQKNVEKKSVSKTIEPAPIQPKIETKPTIDIKKMVAKLTAEKSAAEKKPYWTYEGNQGPENWGKLNPDFSTCDTGRNQSPIDIEKTINVSLKPLKLFHRYPVKNIVNNGQTVQANFKEGNMLILDSTPFVMKQVDFHAPSEHQIKGKSYPLEAQFIHVDTKGNLAVIGVMFEEGMANPALESLWIQLPRGTTYPVNMKSRVLASEFMPSNRSYYQFSGSITTPPCSEGVRWIIMKNPITASKVQIETFRKTIKHPNNRPVQALNGRVVVEDSKTK